MQIHLSQASRPHFNTTLNIAQTVSSFQEDSVTPSAWAVYLKGLLEQFRRRDRSLAETRGKEIH